MLSLLLSLTASFLSIAATLPQILLLLLLLPSSCIFYENTTEPSL